MKKQRLPGHNLHLWNYWFELIFEILDPVLVGGETGLEKKFVERAFEIEVSLLLSFRRFFLLFAHLMCNS